MIRKITHKNRILKAITIFMASMLLTVSFPAATYAAQTETTQSSDSESDNAKVVTIEDDEVPLAPEPMEKNSNASWWFILIAIVTATADNKTYYANVLKNVVEKLDFTITQNKPDNLYVKEAFINEGRTLKRMRFGSRGHVEPIKKRTSHITIVVSDRN